MKDLNGWLLKLGSGGTWKGIVEWSGKVADVLDKGVRGALDWITSREWSFANLKKGLADLWGVARRYAGQMAGLFVFKADGRLQAGPLVNLVVAAFRLAADEVEGLFNVLWIRVGDRFTSVLLDALAGVGQHMNQAIMARQEARGKDIYGKASSASAGPAQRRPGRTSARANRRSGFGAARPPSRAGQKRR